MFRFPLMGTGRALGQFPFVAEQVPKEVGAPLRWCCGPDDFQAACNCVAAFATAKTVLPAKALLFNARALRLWTDMNCIASAMGLTKSMAAGDEGNSFLIVHGH